MHAKGIFRSLNEPLSSIGIRVYPARTYIHTLSLCPRLAQINPRRPSVRTRFRKILRMPLFSAPFVPSERVGKVSSSHIRHVITCFCFFFFQHTYVARNVATRACQHLSREAHRFWQSPKLLLQIIGARPPLCLTRCYAYGL